MAKVRARPPLNTRENTNLNVNKNILDRLEIIILIIKEFIRILENKYIYSNIKKRVKLQASIEPVKGRGDGGDDDGSSNAVKMVLMAPARWRGHRPSGRCSRGGASSSSS
jgi:hypothetical protein